jgi:hypothetical protein
MADAPQTPDAEATKVEKPKFEKGTKFFRCESFSGLQIATDQVDEIGNPTHERFNPYFEKFQGDTVKVGYLASSNARVLEVLANDSNVEEIEQREFEKATGEKAIPAPRPVA